MVDEEAIAFLRKKILEQLDLVSGSSDESLRELVEDQVFTFSEQTFLSAPQKKKCVETLFHSFRGMDILQPLLDDPEITEIMVNRFDEIFIEKDGKTERFPGKFESPGKLEDIIQTMVGKVNRSVNESMPIVDARLADGSRINVVLSPVSLKGPALTVRKFPSTPLTMKDLIRKQAITEEAAEFLQKMVEAKYNILIGGGTGSGKTTFLNVLSNFIPEDERIITIEDSAELQIRSIPNVVSLETRNRNTEGKGEITLRELIRSSLRMRPNRIIVGEVRGADALDMLQAMNTGHDGSLSTAHANSCADMLSRLETMILSGAPLPIDVIRQQIASAVDILVHLSRMRDKTRKIVEIHEITGYSEGEIKLNPLFLFEEEEGTTPEVRGYIKPTGNSLLKTWKMKMAGIEIRS